jgi:hypothetical protein
MKNDKKCEVPLRLLLLEQSIALCQETGHVKVCLLQQAVSVGGSGYVCPHIWQKYLVTGLRNGIAD